MSKERKEYTVSETTGLKYNPKDMARIVNQKQCALYLIHGATLYDVYATRDYTTNEPILVYLFSKAETGEMYRLWQKRELL